MIFEAVSNRDVTAEALATTLQVLKDKTPKIKESHSMSSKLNDLIERLKDPEFDDSAIYEAEDLIATVQEELTATEGLSDFDIMPGEDSMPEDLDDEDSDAENTAAPAPIININAPLISIGSSNISGGEEEDFDGLDGLDGLDDLGDDEDLGEEEDESLADLLGGEEDLGDGDEGDLDDLDEEEESPFESRRSRKSVNEGGLPAHLEKYKFGSKNDSDDDGDDSDDDDSDDDEKRKRRESQR